MKYRIFLIDHQKGTDVELHNLEAEQRANSTSQAFTTLEKNMAPGNAKGFADVIQNVLGRDCCEIIQASRRE